MADRTPCDAETRLRASVPFDGGAGYKAAANVLGVPREAVREWLGAYRPFGVDGLVAMGSAHASHPFEARVARA